MPAVELECCSYAAIGRLEPRVSESQAAADVSAVVPALAAKTPRLYAGVQARVVALRDEITGDVRAALWVLLASVGLLLGVACANATNLLFARNAARVRETAVRTALGASRGRILAQSLAEAAMAAAAAAGLGLILASGLIDGFTAIGSPGFPRLDADAVRIDLPVFGFALIIVSATTLVMGVLPIMRSANVMSALKTGAPGMSAGPNRRRLQNGLVIGQLAVSVVLLVGASLLGRSFVRLMRTDIGVRTDRVATAAIDLAYQRSPTDAQQAALVDDIVERVRSLPDVQAAGVGASLPPRASTIRLTLKRSADAVDYQAIAVPATPGYFAALGVRLLKGRLFTEADVETGTQVMIMTADTARRFFDTNDPIGRTMPLPVLRNGITRTAEVTLVGVIANVKHSGLQAAPDDAIYRPLRQQHWPSLFVVARTSADPQVLVSVLRREIAAVDPGIAVSSVNTLDEIVATETAQPRFNSALLAGLSTLTLAIASIGLYGVVAHTVSQRTREFGVRMALGADGTSLLRLVFREGATLAGAGIALGVAASLVTTRMLTSLLYGIGPTDGFSFGLASGLLLLVAAAATCIPARRAARLDPTVALRAE
jgi:putative ABC transport system permease protein